MEFLSWLDKFRYWIGASFGSFQPESASLANELCMKLDFDWTALLKSVLDWETASYDEIVEAIKNELLIQHPTLTRRATLFSMNLEKGENLCDFLTRVESQAPVCNVEEGLDKEQILLLCMLRATSQETRTKILQLFVQKEPSVNALKLYADNIRFSECKLTGSVNIHSKGKAKPKKC